MVMSVIWTFLMLISLVCSVLTGSGSALAATAVNILNAYFAPSDIGTALIPEGALLP